MPGFRPSLCSSVICGWAKQTWFISQGGGQTSQGLLLHLISQWMNKEPAEEKAKGSQGEAAFMLIFLKHTPFSQKVKRAFCTSVSPSHIILVTNSQFSILWFIYSEINEPFAQHFPAFISSYSTLSLVNCPLSFSKALSEHLCKQKNRV